MEKIEDSVVESIKKMLKGEVPEPFVESYFSILTLTNLFGGDRRYQDTNIYEILMNLTYQFRRFLAVFLQFDSDRQWELIRDGVFSKIEKQLKTEEKK